MDNNKIAITKYPIVLVHGIALKDIFFLKAFGRIRKKLIASGYTVHVAKTDGFGSIENNSAQLKQEIVDLLQKNNVDKVNIIAHSKGGLDAKFMIENLDMASHVSSLTTLCTPHQGSPIASWILKLPRPLLKFIAFWINLWYRIFGDKHPDALLVCNQLKLQNEKTSHIPPEIYCQSYSSTLEKCRDDFVMSIPLLLSKHLESLPSDGLVSNVSAAFGNYKGDCCDASISHGQIVDFMSTKNKRERVFEFYIGLCSELAELGF